MTSGYSIERARDHLKDWREVPLALEPSHGEVIARVDIAALTSNNVTYAVHGGPPLFYWNFFPASDQAFGIVPVWGYGTVVSSRAAHVPEGSRFYGYWPSASHVRLRPGPDKAGGFSDMSPHRQGLAAVYNSYRPAGDVLPTEEPLVALFQPLYGTGFVLAHSLSADAAAGRHLVLTSASSKTALATAFALKEAGAAAVGLTSAANKGFVERSGLYARVFSYEEAETLNPAEPSVLVDFAGNGALKARLHRHLKSLVASHIVGDTDWAAPAQGELEGPQPALFFAPSAWEARAREIGPAAFEAGLAASLKAFLAATPGWLKVETVTGPSGYAGAFNRLLENRVPAETGLVWRP